MFFCYAIRFINGIGLLWPACIADAGIIFCVVVSSIFLLSYFLSSPNLSGGRLDVCHTSTHGVALVRIYDAGQKRAGHAARWTCRTQKIAKNSSSAHLRTNLSGHIFAIKARMDNRKNCSLECRPMPNVMAALPNIGGALCSTPQGLADAHYQSAVR